MIFLINKFGNDIIWKFIKFLYFSNYNSMYEITKTLFNLNKQKFYELWSFEAQNNK